MKPITSGAVHARLKMPHQTSIPHSTHNPGDNSGLPVNPTMRGLVIIRSVGNSPGVAASTFGMEGTGTTHANSDPFPWTDVSMTSRSVLPSNMINAL